MTGKKISFPSVNFTQIINNNINNMVKPGFVRVLIPARNKTISIRQQLAANKEYMARNGMVPLPEPIMPPKPLTPPPPTPEIPTAFAADVPSTPEAISAVTEPKKTNKPKTTKK